MLQMSLQLKPLEVACLISSQQGVKLQGCATWFHFCFDVCWTFRNFPTVQNRYFWRLHLWNWTQTRSLQNSQVWQTASGIPQFGNGEAHQCSNLPSLQTAGWWVCIHPSIRPSVRLSVYPGLDGFQSKRDKKYKEISDLKSGNCKSSCILFLESFNCSSSGWALCLIFASLGLGYP